MNAIPYILVLCIILGVIPTQAQTTETTTWDIQTCIAHAITHNIQIKQNSLLEQKATLQWNQAKWEYAPSLQANASQTFSNNGKYSAIGMQSDMTLYNGNKTAQQIKLLEKQTTQWQLKTEETKNNIILSITEAYLQALYYKEQIAIQTILLETTEKELQLTQIKFDIGALSSKELSNMQSQFAQNQYALTRAQNQYKQQLLSLSQLLELPMHIEFQIQEPTVDIHKLIIPSSESMLSESLHFLPEYAYAKEQVNIDSIAIQIARASYYPSFSLSAGISSTIHDYQANVFPELHNSMSNTLRLQMTVPIFQKYQRKTTIETAKIQASYNKLSVELVEKDIYKRIEMTRLQAIANQAEVFSLQKVVDAATHSYELSQEQFSYGALPTTELLLAKSQFENANIQLLQAKYMTLLSFQLLQFYQGKSISF